MANKRKQIVIEDEVQAARFAFEETKEKARKENKIKSAHTVGCLRLKDEQLDVRLSGFVCKRVGDKYATEVTLMLRQPGKNDIYVGFNLESENIIHAKDIVTSEKARIKTVKFEGVLKGKNYGK